MNIIKNILPPPISKNEGNHLEFIDLAKGFCILLVVSFHCDNGLFLYSNESINEFFFSFRMPLYYFLSGIFISFKAGYKSFVIKKINRLLIPFLFFFFVTSVICEFIHPGEVPSVFEYLLTEHFEVGWNNAIWFLISLFTTYCFYAVIHKYVSKNIFVIFAISLVIGTIGYLCFYYHINVPFYIDSSMTCFPFVVMGSIMRQKGKLLEEQSRLYCLLGSIVAFVIVFALSHGISMFYQNSYECNLLVVYVCGFFGSLGLIYLAKFLNYLPIVNYIGRYSIVVLGLHIYFIPRPVIKRLFEIPIELNILISFFVAVILSIFAINICRRYIPYFCAQKDLIKFDNDGNK